MSDLLHELDTVSKVHPDPVLRQLLNRAHNALYHLSLEMNKPKYETDHNVEATITPAAIPFLGAAKSGDRL